MYLRDLSILLVVFCASAQLLFGQEGRTEFQLTDKDWTKYAQVEGLTSHYLSRKEDELKKWVKSKEELGGGARFNQIKSVWGNPNKLSEIVLTEKEKKAFQDYLIVQDSLQKMVISYQAELIQDEKVLGTALYHKISKLIREDPSLKEKLVQEVARLKKQTK